MVEGEVSPPELGQKPAARPRRARRRLAYAAYLAAILLVPVYAFFFRPFVSGLRELNRPMAAAFEALGPVPTDVLRQVGGLVVDRASSFVNHPVDKPAGEVRICAFGDSFTYGDEVGRDQDYPSLLETILHDHGFEHVRVLNFGSSWHGFHQSYILWERFGLDYGCDTVVLGPRSFWTRRDTEFNHTNLAFPYYLHSRFVLAGDGVERIDVHGDTHDERFGGYFRFLPRWRYLRYDRQPPAILKSLIGKNRTIANPFYYRRDSADDEALATYRVLITNIAARSDRVLLMHTREEILEMGRDLALSNLTTFEAFDDDRFPYRAPKGHHSVWGNHALAWRVFRHWAPDARGAFTLVTTDTVRASGSITAQPRELSEYRELKIVLGDTPIGELVTASPDPWQAGRPTGMAFWGKDVASALILEGAAASVLDGRVLPLGVELQDGSVLRLRAADGTLNLELGRIEKIGPELPIGKVRVPDLHVRSHDDLRWIGTPLPTTTGLTIYVDETPVLASWLDGDEVKFWPPESDAFKFAAGSSFIDPQRLPESGTFDLRLVHPEDGVLRVPFAEWRRSSNR
jgi:hypothetical protein